MLSLHVLAGLMAHVTVHVSTARAQNAKSPLNVTFPDVPVGVENVVQDNFLGISFELAPFNTLWGETPSTMPTAMKNYISNIRARMSNPLRVRIGGNGMDGSTYAPEQTDMINRTDPNANFNDIPVSFGPTFFDVLNAMADETGEMEYMIGLSMRDPANDENVISLAAAARSKLGERLDAMLLGNEPDLYAGHGNRANYTIEDYVPEIGKILNDLTNSPYGDLMSTSIIGGPTVCCGWDLDDILEAGLNKYPYKYYTIQHYPTHVCGGQSAASSNISYYLSHMNVAPFMQWNDAGMAMAKELGVPVLLTEFNSASCGGDPNVAPTFATALWAVDVALKGASLNFTALYLHTREANITYNLFDPPGTTDPPLPGWRTGAIYYAMLVVAEALSDATSVVLDLNLANSTTDPEATVASYAVFDGSEREKSKLVLLNFAYPKADAQDDDTNTTIQTFVLPANLTSTIGARYLLAPNITDHTEIVWAGQTVGANGALEGSQTLDLIQCADGCEVHVSGPGLALVWLNPETQGQNIYIGNSTVVDNFSGGVISATGSVSIGFTVLTGMFCAVLLYVP